MSCATQTHTNISVRHRCWSPPRPARTRRRVWHRCSATPCNSAELERDGAHQRCLGIVTGGSRGLGFQIAQKLAAGSPLWPGIVRDVVILAQCQERCAAACQQLQSHASNQPGTVRGRAVDLGDLVQLRELLGALCTSEQEVRLRKPAGTYGLRRAGACAAAHTGCGRAFVRTVCRPRGRAVHGLTSSLDGCRSLFLCLRAGWVVARAPRRFHSRSASEQRGHDRRPSLHVGSDPR